MYQIRLSVLPVRLGSLVSREMAWIVVHVMRSCPRVVPALYGGQADIPCCDEVKENAPLGKRLLLFIILVVVHVWATCQQQLVSEPLVAGWSS